MNMETIKNNKNKVILIFAYSLVIFAAGRWLAPTKVKTEVKVVEKIVTKLVQDKSTDKTSKTIKNPDGTVITETHTKTDTTTKTDGVINVTTEDKKEVATNTSKVHLNVLGGLNLDKKPAEEVYGLHVSKDFIGPISIGAFGLSSGTLGVSIGISF